MTEPSASSPAGAGLTLVATMLLCGGAGLGIGALVGLAVPLGITGLFVGLVAGFALVYTRFRDI
jgi:hypothetical protein